MWGPEQSGCPQKQRVRLCCSPPRSRPFLSRVPGTQSRDNGDIFLRLFLSWLCRRKAEKPRHEVTACFRRERKKKSRGSIVFALLRLIFSLQFPLLIANFPSFSESHSTSALFLPPPRAGAWRTCHRWAQGQHTCLFGIHLKSSSPGATGRAPPGSPGLGTGTEPRGRQRARGLSRPRLRALPQGLPEQQAALPPPRPPPGL